MSSFGENFERDENKNMQFDTYAFFPVLERFIILLIFYTSYKLYSLFFKYQVKYQDETKYRNCQCKACKQRLNNLYNDYKKFKTKIENMKNDLSKEEMKDCSFTPQINKYSKKLVKNNSNYSKPIYLRNNENKKEFYKKKYELNFTHMPKINKNY